MITKRPYSFIVSLAAAFLVSIAWLPSGASAQRLGGSRFSPAGSPDGVLGTEGADTRPALYPYVGLFANYALNPVVVSDAQGNEKAVVEHFFGTDLVASMALWKGLELGATLPVSLVRSGDDAVASSIGVASQNGAAFGDIIVRAAYRFQLGYFTALALHVPVLLPTSKANDTLGLGFGVRPTIAFTHHFGRLQLALNLSYLFRKSVDLVDYKGGGEFGARAAVRFSLDEAQRTGILGEVAFASAARDFFGPAVSPAEIRGGIEHRFADVWRITGFLGTAVATGVGSPDLRVGLGIGYVPEASRPRPTPTDHDGDGIANEQDRCPEEAEDEDGFQDKDGCPEPDNDRDGVLDGDDECPNAPETINQFRDEDGCPDFVRLEDTQIVTFQPVFFKTNSNEVADRSKPMLTEVAHIMQANPEMKVRVEGHTDSQGDARYNLELSQKRAASVAQFLADQGVDNDRIQSKGFGETRPIATNQTAKGRARNRRVEFHILWQEQ